MTIAAIASASTYVPPAPDSSLQSFGQLVNAVQPGNLTATQSAYAAFAQSPADQSDGPLPQAISQIGDALQWGNLGKAQQALASLRQQTQSTQHAHHHRDGHPHAGDDNKSQSATSPTNTDSTVSTTATSTSLVGVTA
jgi:hypothetical protein